MSSLLNDLRYGFRVLYRDPGFSLAALLALGLGIAANCSIFSIVYATLIAPLPYADPDRLVTLSEVSSSDVEVASPGNFVDWKEKNQVFTDMAAYSPAKMVLTGETEPLLVRTVSASSNLFSVLGAKAAMGRTFVATKSGAEAVPEVVLDHRFWAGRLHADPQAVGKGLMLDGRRYSVVGVMPPEFRFVSDVEVYVLGPEGLPQPPFAYSGPIRDIRTGQYVRVIGRLKSGTGGEQAKSAMAVIARQLEAQYPETNKGWTVKIVPFRERYFGSVRTTVLVLFGAVGFVLLIACANVANLFLARLTVRRQEIALRTALGAGRSRLVRQILSEGLILCLLGGLIGILLSTWGVKALLAIKPDSLPSLAQVQLNGWVLAFTLLLSLLVGLAVSLVPALQVARTNVNEPLQEEVGRATGGLRRRWFFSALVVSEIAVALVLLVGASLLLTSLMRLLRIDPGFHAPQVLTMQLTLPDAKYPNPRHVVAFNEQLMERLRDAPGIVAAGTTSDLPLSGIVSTIGYRVEDSPVPQPNTDTEQTLEYHQVTRGYLKAMGIPLLSGRDFDDRDVQGVPFAVIVSQSLAERYWPGKSPISGKLMIGGDQAVNIIGVMGDVRHTDLSQEPHPTLLVSALQLPSPTLWLVVRTEGDPMAALATVKERIAAVDPDLPVDDVKTLDQLVAKATAAQRFTSLLLVVLAAVALILAVVGIYSVVSFSVGQRTREICIRMALGAQRRDVLRMVVGQAGAFALVGVVLGLVMSFGLTRTLKTLLFNVSANDPWILGTLALSVVLVVLLASYLPARRAMGVDPVAGLRQA